MSNAYITVLTTNDYLPGVLVVNRSLRLSGARIPHFTCVTDAITRETRGRLEQAGIGLIEFETLESQASVVKGYCPAHWRFTFSKLQIFGLTQFSKIVYLDADMLVCAELDHLFSRPHLSAVNAGGFLHADWRQLCSGLMVIEPSIRFQDELLEIWRHEKSQFRSDQDVIQRALPGWPLKDELRLDHAYNMFDDYLTKAKEILDYRIVNAIGEIEKDDDGKIIKVIHFVSKKPWQLTESERKELSPALKLWFQAYAIA